MKNIIKLFTLGAIIMPTTALISCANNKDNGTINPGNISVRERVGTKTLNTAGNVSVAMVTANKLADINDNSFNEMLYNGLKGSAGLSNNVVNGTPDVYKPSSDTVQDLKNAYTTALRNNKLLVLGGFQHTNALKDFSFPTGKGAVEWGDATDNESIVNVIHHLEENSFIVGVLTGMYLNTHYEEFKDGGLNVGGFAGLDVPNLVRYLGGFQQGVKYFNNHIVNNSIYNEYLENGFKHKVNWIDLGARKDHFTNGFVPNAISKAKSDSLIGKGADFIFSVAGKQAASVIKSIDDHNKKGKVFLIGVDAPMSTQSQYKEYVLFSTINSTSGLSKIIHDTATGAIPLGTQIEGGIRARRNVKKTLSISLSKKFIDDSKNAKLKMLIDKILGKNSISTNKSINDIYVSSTSDIARKFDF